MNRSEYMEYLRTLEQMIDSSKQVPNKVFEELDKLYEMKPIATKYHQVRCKALMKQGKESPESLLLTYNDCVSRECTFEGNTELWQQIIELYAKSGHELESKRQRYLLDRLLRGVEGCTEADAQLDRQEERFLQAEGEEQLGKELAALEEQYYVTGDVVMAACVWLYRMSALAGETGGTKKAGKAVGEEKELLYLQRCNMGYFAEMLKEHVPVILIAGQRERRYDILAFLLHALGLEVFLLLRPERIEGDYLLEETVGISLENSIQYEDCVAVPLIERAEGERKEGRSNLPYVIDALCREHTGQDFALVIGDQQQLEALRGDAAVSGRFERMSEYEADYMEDKIGFARAGDYLTYCGQLYRCDVKELLDRKPTCRFSIVIPVRNSADTLEYTLKTCLHQEFAGDYEIVLSDNSAEGNTDILALYQRLNHPKIRYYRPPRELSLAKSFEYAYLHAQGEFLIPIGADDGLFPWTLSTLSAVLEQRPQEELVLWARGFYAWPGFNGGQENMLEISSPCKKGKIEFNYMDGAEALKFLISHPSRMYGIPNLYINSGFRRGYLRKLYERTGSILDGMSQDICMGIENLMLNPKILQMYYPLAIAGMSGHSIGYISTENAAGGTEEQKKQYRSLMLLGRKGWCTYVPCKKERMIPKLNTDVSMVYAILARLEQKNIGTGHLFETGEQIAEIYKNCFDSIHVTNEYYEKYVMESWKKAQFLGKEVAAWLEQKRDSALGRLDRYHIVPKEERRKKKLYREGYTEQNGVTLDASRYGVTTIEGAVELFRQFLNF